MSDTRPTSPPVMDGSFQDSTPPLLPPPGPLAPPPAAPWRAPGSTLGNGEMPTAPPPLLAPTGPGFGPTMAGPPAPPMPPDPRTYGGNDLIPPAHPPSTRGDRGRPAMVGALVGAVVASLVAGVLFLAIGRGDRVLVETSASSRPSNTIAGESLDIQSLLAKVRPSVVSIETDSQVGRSLAESAGSGIVIDAEGLVLTNAHVINGATRIRIAFSDGSTRDAQLVGSFPDDDVALVRTTDGTPTVPAELGSSDDLQVGDDVVAIGNALNLGAQPSVTKGIVSAKDRSIGAQGIQLENLIQTDAAINPGNSGGPLVNAAGQVVGINTAIIQDSQNVGFSLAIDSVMPLVEEIKAGRGDIDGDSAFLGVSSTDIDEQPADVLAQARVEVTAGAFVVSVQSGTAAAEAGFEEGDVIISIDGVSVAGKDDVGAAIRKKEPGDRIEVTVLRRGERTMLSATLGRRGG